MLRREGVWSDMASLYDVTEADASSWWYAGERTLADLTATGNAEQIRRLQAVRQQLASTYPDLRD